MLIYLHGFNSSPASRKARVLQACMEGKGRGALFACPALPDTPAEAIAAIEHAVAGRDPCTVTYVGSSLGGYYATWLVENRGGRAVLINPAITPHVGLRAYLGTQKNLHTGAAYELTRAHLEGWRALQVERIDPEKYLLLLETGDEVLDWREAARKYEGARTAIRDGGDHSLQSFSEHLGRILAFAGVGT
jgi:uncharacterized protein